MSLNDDLIDRVEISFNFGLNGSKLRTSDLKGHWVSLHRTGLWSVSVADFKTLHLGWIE